MFEWQQEGDIFTVAFPNGRAVIKERRLRGFSAPIGGGYAYEAQLQDADGMILDWTTDISSFEQAESWVAAMIPFHRRELYASSRVALLQRCQRGFDAESEALFVERLEEIIDWLSSGRGRDRGRAPELEAIQWAETDQGWLARGPAGLELLISACAQAPSPYRIGARDQQFRPEIRHRSGAMVHSRHAFSELADAQDWIAEQIALLHTPGLDKETLPAIELTLRICQRFVDDDAVEMWILGDLASELVDWYL
jgi:hypothetical protein